MLSGRCTVVHQVKKQSTVHVSLGLGVPPCQHDRSLLHTERLWCLEVVPRLRNDASHTLYSRPAPTEEVDVPTQLWWHSAQCDIWCVYKQWACGMGLLFLLTVLCGSHMAHWCTAGWKGRFSCNPYRKSNSALEMWLRISKEITTQSRCTSATLNLEDKLDFYRFFVFFSWRFSNIVSSDNSFILLTR